MMFLQKSQSLVVLLILCCIIHLVCAACNSKGQCFKTYENVNRRVDFYLCGNMIPSTVRDVCYVFMTSAYDHGRQKSPKKSKSIVYSNPEDAKRFRIAKRTTFNIVEECCKEGCTVEEVREYC